MNTQARLFLAFSLMFLVMILTNVIWPPMIPDVAVSPDSASAAGTEAITDREPSEPIPTIPEIALSPSEEQCLNSSH